MECIDPMGDSGDRFELMRLFVRIAESRSLAAAGRLVGLSQPSISRQLKQLETMLGVQLVRRTTHEIALTDAGEQFLPAAIELIAGWEAATEAGRLARNDLRGPIRAATPVALGQTLLAQIAARFAIEYPAVLLDWRLDDEPGDLAAGGYDLWIRAGVIRDQSLIVTELLRAERSIVAHVNHPRVRHPSELNHHRAVQLLSYVPLQIPLVGDNGEEAILQLRPAFKTDNIYAAIVAVSEGVGYGVLPHWSVQEQLESGLLVELCPTWRPPAVTMSVAYPQSRFRPARVKVFIDYLQRELLRTRRSAFEKV